MGIRIPDSPSGTHRKGVFPSKARFWTWKMFDSRYMPRLAIHKAAAEFLCIFLRHCQETAILFDSIGPTALMALLMAAACVRVNCWSRLTAADRSVNGKSHNISLDLSTFGISFRGRASVTSRWVQGRNGIPARRLMLQPHRLRCKPRYITTKK